MKIQSHLPYSSFSKESPPLGAVEAIPGLLGSGDDSLVPVVVRGIIPWYRCCQWVELSGKRVQPCG